MRSAAGKPGQKNTAAALHCVDVPLVQTLNRRVFEVGLHYIAEYVALVADIGRCFHIEVQVVRNEQSRGVWSEDEVNEFSERYELAVRVVVIKALIVLGDDIVQRPVECITQFLLVVSEDPSDRRIDNVGARWPITVSFIGSAAGK